MLPRLTRGAALILGISSCLVARVTTLPRNIALALAALTDPHAVLMSGFRDLSIHSNSNGVV
jgi:hypothetical protein